MAARAWVRKPPGRWLLTHYLPPPSGDEPHHTVMVDAEDVGWQIMGDATWVAEDLNGAGVGGAAPTRMPALDLLEAAERRLALAKLAQPRLGPSELTWDPNVEQMVGILVVGLRLDPWPVVEEEFSDGEEGDEDEVAQRTCIREVLSLHSPNAEADVRNARMKMHNPCCCYRCLMRQLAVVIDIGPRFTGVAFSNNPHVAIFPSAVAHRAQEPPQLKIPPDLEPEPEKEAGEISPVAEGVPRTGPQAMLVVGDAALALPSVRRPLGALAQPSKGVPMDWSALEAVWRHSYTRVLCAEPGDHALVMTEPAVNPKATRERLTTLAFTTFRVPSFYLLNTTGEFRLPGFCLSSQCMRVGSWVAKTHSVRLLPCSFAAATLYGSGRTTGTVIFIDSAGIAVSAVYEGYLLPHTSKYSDIGGDAIGHVLVPALERAGCVFANPIEKMDCILDLVKAMAVVPLDQSNKCSDAALPPESCFELRRGLNGGLNHVKVTAAERLACGEALFDPSTVWPGRPQRVAGLADTLFSSFDCQATTDE